MAIRVTQKWSEYKLSDRYPWTATLVFEVTGTQNAATALTAVDPTSGLRIPQRNDGWTPGNSLICSGPYVSSRPSLEHWVVQTDYSVPEAGSFPDNPTNPLLQATRCTAEEMEISEPADVDLDGRPIYNAAWDYLEGHTRDVNLMVWTFERNYPFWNQAWHDDYVMGVNDNPVVIAGVQFPKEHVKIVSVKPSESFITTARFVPVAWKFACVPDGVLGPHPWQTRLANAGLNGWYSKSGTVVRGRITRPNSSTATEGDRSAWDSISEPVALDLLGKPLFSPDGEKIAAGHTPLQASRIFQAGNGTGTDRDCFDTDGDATKSLFLYFKRSRIISFGGIPL